METNHKYNMLIKQQYLPSPSLRRSGQKMTAVKAIVLHDVGAPNSTAQNNVDFYTRTANDQEASAHTFVDDIQVIECIPATEKAWHVRYIAPQDNQLLGFDCNDFALGVELCYFDDKVKSLKAYENYVEYVATQAVKYNIAIDKIKGHEELDPGRKTDPTNACARIGKTLQGLKNDIKAKITPITAPTAPIFDKEAYKKDLIAKVTSLIQNS